MKLGVACDLLWPMKSDLWHPLSDALRVRLQFVKLLFSSRAVQTSVLLAVWMVLAHPPGTRRERTRGELPSTHNGCGVTVRTLPHLVKPMRFGAARYYSKAYLSQLLQGHKLPPLLTFQINLEFNIPLLSQRESGTPGSSRIPALPTWGGFLLRTPGFLLVGLLSLAYSIVSRLDS